MASKSRLFSKLLGSGTSGTIPQTSISSDVSFGVSTYDNITTLPLSGNNIGDQAFVDSDNRLYIWNGSGWYNIALINTSPSITGGYESSYVFETDGTPIEITLVGSDPEGIPLTWSYEVTSGSLTNGGGPTATVSNVDNVFTITPTTTEDYAGEFSLTFKASDGVNLGTAVSSFTLRFKIVNSNYTTLMAKGIAATQNATFIDSSTNNYTMTPAGDVYQGTFSPFRTGGYSMYFNGSTNYVFRSGNDIFNFASNDFTIETWVYLNAMPTADSWPTSYSSHFMVAGTGSPSAGDGCNLLIGSNRLAVQSNDTAYWSTAHGLTINRWYHIAVSRSSGTLYFFVDGVAVGTNTLSGNVGTGSNTYIGCETNQGAFFNGYMHNLRVVNGTALYTSAFTPATDNLTNIANTSLLTFTKPYVVDESSNAYALTVNGSSMKPFTRFDYEKYSVSVNGASAYFDGTGDWVTTPNVFDLSGSSDFTIEAWVYNTGGGVNRGIIGARTNNTGNGWCLYISDSNTFNLGSVIVGNSYANRVLNTVLVPPNTWAHVALVKTSTGYKGYVNGIPGSEISLTGGLDYQSSQQLIVGALGSGGELPFIGYITNVRIIQGTALYTAAFDPPTAPLTAITNTSLLLNFTNAGIQDYSQVSNLKLLGNATGSNTQTKNAAYSMYFDGSASGALLQYNSLHQLNGDFTIELWFYTTALDGSMIINCGGGLNIAWASYELVNQPDGINFAASSANSGYDIGSETGTTGRIGTISLNTWNHLAVTRSGNVYRGFVNGVQGYTQTLSLTPYNTAPRGLAIGHNYSGTWASTPSSTISGYIEDLRITKGLARYTANFTPPTTELLG